MKRSESMREEMARLKLVLKGKGYKLTPQRRAILEIILGNEGKHMSTEEIYMEVKKTCPEIGLATVYRTMLLLEELGVLNKHNFEDGRNRYELNHPEEDHHHLICIACGKVIEVESDLLDNLEKVIDMDYEFQVTNHKVKFFGYCNRCR